MKRKTPVAHQALTDLRNVVRNYPVKRGRMISEESLNDCLKLQWVALDELGRVIPMGWGIIHVNRENGEQTLLLGVLGERA